MAAGRGMVYWTHWIRLRDAKKHNIKTFWWFKCDLISQWIPKFYLCDESNPINPQCGIIPANFYISPPHPPHPQFYPQKWWKFRYTSWLTKKKSISIDLRGAQVNDHSVVGYVSRAHCIVLLYSVRNKITTTTTCVTWLHSYFITLTS